MSDLPCLETKWMMWWLVAFYQIAVILFDTIILVLKCIVYTILSVFRIVFPKEMKDVVGETILITGTGHGIGRELALQFSRLGARIVCVDLNEEANKQTVAQITKEGGTAWGFWCDVSKREEVKDVSNKIRRQIGDITILLNNAGIVLCKPFIKHSDEDIERTFRVNVYAHYWTIQEWLPTFLKKGRGHIVSVSSLCGVSGLPNLVPYCSSKFAVTGLIEALNEELRVQNPNVKLTRVHPFHVNTGIIKSPRVRFSSFTKIMTPEYCASKIVDGVRREDEVLVVPTYYSYFFTFFLSAPRKVQQAIADFLDVGADSHED
ncbi:UNVERIFIED_CONTAM: hypothetical protein RMT77_011440 [Armadillidium vulgare]